MGLHRVDRLVSTERWVRITRRPPRSVSHVLPSLDVHTQLENDLANAVGQESAIIYAQAFSTASSVIPAFAKRGDIVVVDKAVNFGIQKGVQISRSTVKWFEPNDMEDLERVLKGVERDAKRKGGPLKRRFIITEGIFENTGVLVNLPRIVRLLDNRVKARIHVCRNVFRFFTDRVEEKVQVQAAPGRVFLLWHARQNRTRSDRVL